MGILGIVLGCLPIGIPAWVMSRRDLKAMDQGFMDPAGRGLTQAGRVLGIVGTCVGVLVLAQILIAGLAIFMVSRGQLTSYMSNDAEPGVRHGSTNYPNDSNSYGPSTRDREWREILDANGKWVKDGPAWRWSRDHQFKLEEGGYREGNREGEWIYVNEDGSMDLARSGIYENDVRVRPPSPAPTPRRQ